jgi:ferrous iron transport protein B
MGLTSQSTGMGILVNELKIQLTALDDKVVALAGNPNVGKSTVFNSLTGLNQHTGNWPGKTVSNAQGKYRHKDINFIMVDIPGTYSLMANSVEEQVARDFVCFGQPDTTVVVTDATCLERNLNLVLQTMEITDKVVVCVNLIDEAERKKIKIDYNKLSDILGVPVIPTAARNNKGLDELMDAVYNVGNGIIDTTPIEIKYEDTIEKAINRVQDALPKKMQTKINSRWVALKLLDGDSTLLESLNKYLGFNLLDDVKLTESLEAAKSYLSQNGIGTEQFRDRIVSKLITYAEEICRKTVTFERKQYNSFDRKIDRFLTSRAFGIPIMLILLAGIFWLTIVGANIPSEMLSKLLFWVEERLTGFFVWLNTPEWIHSLLVTGVYKTVAWVVSVMLPPMAIFFPLFTLLEDLGYLPRVAFNLDNFFKKACAHGKQALTMCMVKPIMCFFAHFSPLYNYTCEYIKNQSTFIDNRKGCIKTLSNML